MTISGDTDDIISTSLWGESVTIYRNTPSFGNFGEPTDSWGLQSTVACDIQPLGGSLKATEIGLQKNSTHKLFFPASTSVIAGDRVRPSGWVTGDDEYIVDVGSSFEDHVEADAHMVKGHA